MPDKDNDIEARIAFRVSRIRQLGTGTQRVAIAVLFASILIVTKALPPIITDVENLARQRQAARKRLTSTSNKYQKAKVYFEKNKASAQITPERLSTLKDILGKRRAVREAASTEFEAARTALEKRTIIFELFGNKIDFSAKHAPGLLNSVIFVVLLFMFLRRREMLRLTAQMIRLKRTAPSSTEEHETAITDIIGTIPFWVAPLPRNSTCAVKSKHIRLALAWDLIETRNTVLTITALGGIGILQLLICTYSVRINVLWESTFFWAPLVSFIILGVTFIVIVLWLSLDIIDDSHLFEVSKAAMRRREFILSACSFVIAVSMLPIYRRFRFVDVDEQSVIAGVPRFIPQEVKARRKANRITHVSRKPGFYKNKRSDIVHHVSAQGIILDAHQLNPAHLVTSSSAEIDNQAFLPRLQLATACRTLEAEALKQIRQKKHNSACELLHIAIGYDRRHRQWSLHRPAYRIYDLLAALSVRYEPDVDLALLSIVKDDGDDALQKRRKKWDEPNSKWRKRWKNGEKQIKWAGLLM